MSKEHPVYHNDTAEQPKGCLKLHAIFNTSVDEHERCLFFKNKKRVRAYQLMDIFMIHPISNSENRRASPGRTKQSSI